MVNSLFIIIVAVGLRIAHLLWNMTVEFDARTLTFQSYGHKVMTSQAKCLAELCRVSLLYVRTKINDILVVS